MLIKDEIIEEIKAGKITVLFRRWSRPGAKAGGTQMTQGGVIGIDSVEVWIFGERNANGATNLGKATLLSDGTWSLTFLPTRFTSTHTNIYVYVHSSASGLENVASRGFNITG